jgi:RNA polymerase primary sigma factor
MEKEKALDLIKNREYPIEVYRYYKKTKDKEVRDALFSANEKLVYFVLGKYKTSKDYEDILQNGRIGLLLALERFNPDYGTKFSTFAAKYISGIALRYMNESNAAGAGCHFMADIRKIFSYEEEFPNSSVNEIAEALHLKEQEVLYARNAINILSPVSLQTGVASDIFTIQETIADERANVEREMIAKELSEIILDVAHEVFQGDEKSWEVLDCLFGFRGKGAMKLSQTAKKFGIPRQKVVNIQHRFIRAMRHPKTKALLKQRLGVPFETKDIDIADYIFKEESL